MQQSLRFIKEQLQGLYSDPEIRSFSYLMLESVCRTGKQTLLRDKDKQLSANEAGKIRKIVEELKIFRPIQYILGETEFYGLKFKVNEQVLIPRPETEELVERVLRGCTHGTRCTILDIGTGSGCIAVALAKNLPEAKVYALDISEEALEIARQNAELNNVKVNFFQQDLFAPQLSIINYQLSIIVSNPPYIVPSEKQDMSSNVLDYEPHQALFVPEEQPLLFYERIADFGLTHLKDGGQLYFETGSRFGKAVAEMLREKGYQAVELFQDISGKDRIVEAVCSLTRAITPRITG
jgi:release factor glutamine methyltransferase